jgi:hypothetical protein
VFNVFLVIFVRNRGSHKARQEHQEHKEHKNLNDRSVLNSSEKTSLMPKQKYKDEDEVDDQGYEDVDCPECEAIINVHFQKGRNSRRLHCPVCAKPIIVTINREPFPPNLIQLK